MLDKIFEFWFIVFFYGFYDNEWWDGFLEIFRFRMENCRGIFRISVMFLFFFLVEGYIFLKERRIGVVMVKVGVEEKILGFWIVVYDTRIKGFG